ncbi:MAG TPA: hypothetical protein VES38_11685 [Methylotenera sp.]|nr:hypothetical protein [Methylotenera sp.]
MLFDLKERLAGFLLMTIVVPLAIIGYLIVVIIGFIGPVSRARAGVRALDHFVNATVFNGYAWESVSSHAWRERDKVWAKVVIRITDFFQENHCQRANKREQAVIELVMLKRLHEKTIR